MAFVLSAAALAVAGAGFDSKPKVQTKGGGDTAPPAIGASFADLSAGTLRPVQPQPAPAPAPQSKTKTAERTPTPAPSTQLSKAQPPRPNQIPTAAPTAAAAPPPLKALRLAQPAQPTQRPVAPDPAPQKPTAKTETKPAPPPQKAGNATQNARKGTAAGTVKAKAAPANTSKRVAKTQGNAAASNYPGKVMQHLSKARKPRARAKGAAVIAFELTANGQIASIKIAQSSGSSALDNAARRMIENAAPFPAPPKGAQRRFSIKIKGG
jgi:protein TonB